MEREGKLSSPPSTSTPRPTRTTKAAKAKNHASEGDGGWASLRPPNKTRGPRRPQDPRLLFCSRVPFVTASRLLLVAAHEARPQPLSKGTASCLHCGCGCGCGCSREFLHRTGPFKTAVGSDRQAGRQADRATARGSRGRFTVMEASCFPATRADVHDDAGPYVQCSADERAAISLHGDHDDWSIPSCNIVFLKSFSKKI